MILILRGSLVFDPHELGSVARSLVQNGTFANPYPVATGPTAHVAPGGVLIMATILKLLGTGPGAVFTMKALAGTAAALTYAFLPALSTELGLGTTPGLIACAVGSFPWFPGSELTGEWEAPYVALVLVLLTTANLRLLRRLRTESAFLSSGVLALGLAWGLAYYFSPTLVEVLGMLGVALLVVPGIVGRRRYFRAWAGVLAVSLLPTIPWNVRNFRELGTVTFVRSNLGLELRVSNNDEATPTYMGNERAGAMGRHPFSNPDEAWQVLAMGEGPYNRKALGQAVGWIREHPTRFVRLTVGRFLAFWFPSSVHRARDLVVMALFPLMIAGLIMLIRLDGLLAAPLVGAIAGFPVVHYLIQVDARYFYPLFWAELLLATIGGIALVLRSVGSRLTGSAGALSTTRSATSSGPAPRQSS